MNIWFANRSYFTVQIIFTQQEGAVIKNGNNYYRNEALVSLTENILKENKTDYKFYPL